MKSRRNKYREHPSEWPPFNWIVVFIFICVIAGGSLVFQMAGGGQLGKIVRSRFLKSNARVDPVIFEKKIETEYSMAVIDSSCHAINLDLHEKDIQDVNSLMDALPEYIRESMEADGVLRSAYFREVMDGWGNRLDLYTEGDGVYLRSAGPDGKVDEMIFDDIYMRLDGKGPHKITRGPFWQFQGK